MNLQTTEQLQALLNACLRVNAQGKYHAFFHLWSHVNSADVRVRPADHDYQEASTADPLLDAIAYLNEPGNLHALERLTDQVLSFLALEEAAA